jgi:hypothetical protein
VTAWLRTAPIARLSRNLTVPLAYFRLDDLRAALMVNNWPRSPLAKGRGQLMALKRRAVAPAKGLLTEAVLKDARAVPNRRP